MYKKRIGILIILSAVLLLGACDNNDLEERTFQIEENGVTITMTYYYEDDDVIRQTSENVVPYKSMGVNSEEEAREILDPESDKMQGVDGVTEEVKYEDGEATETQEINYEDIDPEEVVDLPGAMLNGNIENGISMEKSTEMILDEGFEEK